MSILEQHWSWQQCTYNAHLHKIHGKQILHYLMSSAMTSGMTLHFALPGTKGEANMADPVVWNVRFCRLQILWNICNFNVISWIFMTKIQGFVSTFLTCIQQVYKLLGFLFGPNPVPCPRLSVLELDQSPSQWQGCSRLAVVSVP